MASMWSSLEDALWGPVPSLGPEWLGKSDASDAGYSLMLTDGCGIWGEKRTSSYVEEKGEEWAPCIEAGNKELASLVLDEVQKLNVKVNWKENRQRLTLHLSTKLNDLAFKWTFSLNRLSDEEFREHWVIPEMVQMHHLGAKIEQLSAELKKKSQQLEELMPENKNNKKNVIPKKKEPQIENSIQAVMLEGRWASLQDQLVNFPRIMKQISSNRKRELEDNEITQGPDTIAPTKGKKGRTYDEDEKDEEIQRIEREKEKQRRAQIQEIQHGTQLSQTPTKKKKKKLNI